MRKLLVALFVLALANFAAAQQKTKSAESPETQKDAKKDKITGEVVDITCYVAHAGRGEKHASCAQKCINSGMPVGLLSDGKLYTVIMKDHTAPSGKLAAWAGKEVSARGTIIAKEGALLFEIDTVEPAAPLKK